MIYRKLLLGLGLLLILLSSCTNDSPKTKGFSINSSSPEESAASRDGLHRDSVNLVTRPGSVLITAFPRHRLIPIYKLNKRTNRGKDSYWTGGNSYHSSYGSYGHSGVNNWNNNFMPGFEAMYGYNMVNIFHHDVSSKRVNPLFEEPGLIRTVYYPTLSKDTLNGEPVARDYLMVSIHDQDSNDDKYINTKDLRHFYLFDLFGKLISPLVPLNYSVISSQYDPMNDYMYVYAVQDENKNGEAEEKESFHMFWIDLKDPKNRGLFY